MDRNGFGLYITSSSSIPPGSGKYNIILLKTDTDADANVGTSCVTLSPLPQLVVIELLFKI